MSTRVSFAKSFIVGPRGKGSAVRLLALLFGAVGCIVALWHPSEHWTVSALVGGGAVSLLVRSRGETGPANAAQPEASPVAIAHAYDPGA